MSISFANRVKAKDSVHVQTLADGEAILLDMKTEEYYSLNDSGRYMWQLLEQDISIEDALNELVAQVPDVDADTLRDDLSGFVDQLVAHGFVEVDPADDNDA